MRQAISGRVITIGVAWRQRFIFDAALFPFGVALTAHVRATRTATAILATLPTRTAEAAEASGGIVRVDDMTIDVVIPAAATAAMLAGTVVFDIIRTDTPTPEHLGFWVTVPVMLPVTRLPA